MNKAAEYIAISKLNSEIKGLHYTYILKSPKAFENLLDKLSNAIANCYDTKRTDAIHKAIDYLTSLPDNEKFSEKISGKIDSILSTELGKNLEELASEPVMELGQQIYKSGIQEVSKNLNMKLAFNVPDREAADILSSHNLFFIKDYYDSQLSQGINSILKDYVTGGKTIKEVSEDFYKKYNDATEKGQAYFEGLAEHTASRSRELGKITGFEKAGIEYYEVRAIIDDRTSDICLSMNGRIFSVLDGINFRDSILSMDNPEDIKSVAPWRSSSEVENLHTSDLPAGMELPPYHFRCRTVVVAYPFSEFQTEYILPSEDKQKEDDDLLLKDKQYAKSKSEYISKASNTKVLRELLPNDINGASIFSYTHGKISIKDIQDDSYTVLNKFCNGKLKEISQNDIEKLSALKELLNASLTKLKTDFLGLTYRAIDDYYDVSKYIEGTIIEEKQFISSSKDKEYGSGGVINFTIKSKSGKFIKQFSRKPEEEEVLFRAGTKFLITKHIKINNIEEIHIEEI